MLYRCILKHGHVGTGKYRDAVRFIRADNALHALQKARRLPGIKKNPFPILSLKPVCAPRRAGDDGHRDGASAGAHHRNNSSCRFVSFVDNHSPEADK